MNCRYQIAFLLPTVLIFATQISGNTVSSSLFPQQQSRFFQTPKLQEWNSLVKLAESFFLNYITQNKYNLHNVTYHYTSSDPKSGITVIWGDQYFSSTNYPILGGKFGLALYYSSGNLAFQPIDQTYDLDISSVDLTQGINADVAEAIAISEINCSNCILEVGSVTLVVLPATLFTPKPIYSRTGTLCYMVELNIAHNDGKIYQPIYFVNANNGDLMGPFDQARSSSGMSLYSGNVTFTSTNYLSTYYLEDLTHTAGVFDCANGNCSVTMNRMTDTDDSWSDPSQRAGVDVVYGESLVLVYLNNVFGRSSLESGGGPTSIVSGNTVTMLMPHLVHSGVNITTATWTGTSIVYGDGDGVTTSAMVALDIVAHEMMHAVVQYTANFIYYGESGSIEEHYCDVLAVLVDQYNYGETPNKTWWFGEQVYTPEVAGDAMRMLDNPPEGPNHDPDHMSGYYNGTNDNGGIHTNAGIINKAFYLVTKGGNHRMYPTIFMDGIGFGKSAAIWYRALSLYLTSSSVFNDLRTWTLFSALQLYGNGNETIAVSTAFAMVGIGAFPILTPQNLVGNSGFEMASSSPWTFFNSTSVTYVTRGANFHNGTGYAQAAGINNAIGNFYQTVSIPTNAVLANLSFWVHIITSDNSGLIHDTLTVNLRNVSTGNPIIQTLAEYSNVNANVHYGLMGPFNMMPYLGQSIRLNFDVYTDSNIITTFYVDDVNLAVEWYL